MQLLISLFRSLLLGFTLVALSAPAIARFLSVDPAPVNPNNGANFNRYWHGNNNPYKYTDPNGREAICSVPGAVCGGSGPTLGEAAGDALDSLDRNVLTPLGPMGAPVKIAVLPIIRVLKPVVTERRVIKSADAARDAAKAALGSEPASQQAARDIATRIEKDLGKDARRSFHDAKESGAGDRTMDQLNQDARDVYIAAEKEVPKWLE
jgi:hypothetical protein